LISTYTSKHGEDERLKLESVMTRDGEEGVCSNMGKDLASILQKNKLLHNHSKHRDLSASTKISGPLLSLAKTPKTSLS